MILALLAAPRDVFAEVRVYEAMTGSGLQELRLTFSRNGGLRYEISGVNPKAADACRVKGRAPPLAPDPGFGAESDDDDGVGYFVDEFRASPDGWLMIRVEQERRTRVRLVVGEEEAKRYPGCNLGRENLYRLRSARQAPAPGR